LSAVGGVGHPQRNSVKRQLEGRIETEHVRYLVVKKASQAKAAESRRGRHKREILSDMSGFDEQIAISTVAVPMELA
jgi:hypothetical protein